MSESSGAKPGSVLRHPDFAWFWASSLISNTGGWMSNLTVPVLLYQITGQAVWVGIFTAANFIPSMVLTPVGGVWADRFDRRRILLFTQLGMGLAGFALWLIVLAGVLDPLLMLLPIFVMGAFMGLNGPSFMAFINDLVPREELRAAVTLNSIQFNIARALGPFVAGILLTFAGPTWALFVNALTYLVVVGVLIFIRAHRPQEIVKRAEHMFVQLRQAAAYMRTQRGIILAVWGGVAGAVLAQPLYGLSVVLAHEIYRVDEFRLGFINALLSIGAVLSIPLLSGRVRRFPLSRAVSWGLLTSGIGIIALGYIQSYEWALPVFLFTGAGVILIMAGTNTVIQLIVRNDLRGRVLALRQITFMAGVPVGTIVGGIASDAIGVQPYLVISGIALVLVTVAMQVFPKRGFTSMDDPHDLTGPIQIITPH